MGPVGPGVVGLQGLLEQGAQLLVLLAVLHPGKTRPTIAENASELTLGRAGW